MKIRTGFVSNSSSTSYVVVFKKNNKEKFTYELFLELLSNVSNFGWDSDHSELLSKEYSEIMKILESDGYNGVALNDIIKKYEKYKKLDIAYFRIRYNDPLSKLLKILIDTKQAIILSENN